MRPTAYHPLQRNQRITVWAGGTVLLAGVVAAVFWFSAGGENPTTSGVPRRPTVRAADHALVVGDDQARTRVVVYEDFLSAESRTFELASRDYLRQDAAAGRVRVEHRPFRATADSYSAAALRAWGVLLKTATPAQALRFHDLLYDEQPDLAPTGRQATMLLTGLARRAGADASALSRAIGTRDTGFVASAPRAAGRADVRQGLAVLVDGRPLFASSAQALADRLETMIARI